MHKVYAVCTPKQTLKRDKPAYICVQTLHVCFNVNQILTTGIFLYSAFFHITFHPLSLFFPPQSIQGIIINFHQVVSLLFTP